MQLQEAIREMKSVFMDVPYGIEHTSRVLENSELIMKGEGISGELYEIVTLAAVLHDIGAIEAKRKHGSMDGHYQEIEGPPIARAILERIGSSSKRIQRVCYIVGNHHTPGKIDGLDFQIVWDADYLEFLQFGEKEATPDALRIQVKEKLFTNTGRNLAYQRLGLSEENRNTPNQAL